MSWSKSDDSVTDCDLFAALKDDPFHNPEPGSSVDALPPEETIWVDPEIASVVDELLDIPVHVEHFPSHDSLMLVNAAQEWLEAAAATDALLGAPSPIDVEQVEDIRYRYERAPHCYNPAAADVRVLIHALDTMERSHLTALVELNRTVLRLQRLIGNVSKGT